MLFNTIDFAIFLPIVFLLYWFVFNKKIETQNIFVIISSYVFYGFWDWRFLILMLISTIVDYNVAYRLSKTKRNSKRKRLLYISLVVNLGLLCFFKYNGFFIDSFISSFSILGVKLEPASLNIILPVGISFYTLQTLSYTIDVYRKEISRTRNFFTFAAYVSFFPQLVAGPIEQAKNLLPQFKLKREFSYDTAIDGLRRILWGLFKKMLIADQCAIIANYVFSNSTEMNGSALLIGVIAFIFQVYGDFSGYSDIAIGTANLFGIKLSQNFEYPFFSRNMREFWRRWHISLNTWFQNYLYIPLGGNKVSKHLQIRNIFIVFILSGLWHGANWNFVVWGIILAFCFIPSVVNKREKLSSIVASESYLPSIKEFFQMISVTSIFAFSMIFFRLDKFGDALQFIEGLMSFSLFQSPNIPPEKNLLRICFFVLFLILFEWTGRKKSYALSQIAKWPKFLKYLIYYILILLILWNGGFKTKALDFFYFQF